MSKKYVFSAEPWTESPYQGIPAAKARLKRRLDLSRTELGLPGLEPWVIHDFRRSVSTGLNERFKVPPHIAERILGHFSKFQGGIQGVYNLADYLDERRIRGRRHSLSASASRKA